MWYRWYECCYFFNTGFLGDESCHCFKQRCFKKRQLLHGLIDSIAKEQGMYLRECNEQKTNSVTAMPLLRG